MVRRAPVPFKAISSWYISGVRKSRCLAVLQASESEGVWLVQLYEGPDGRRRVAIYCRVSTGDQDNDRQERDLREYAERAGYEVVAVFRETLSGVRKAKGKQPIERKRAMALAQAREIDAVLVTEMTRWGRSTRDLMDTLGQLASWDVSLIAQTGLTFDLSTLEGKLIANLMASLSEFEHDLLRERVRSGVAAAKAREQPVAGPPGPRERLRTGERGLVFLPLQHHEADHDRSRVLQDASARLIRT